MKLKKVVIISLCYLQFCHTRSLHRPKTIGLPYIVISQDSEPKKYIFRSSYLRPIPLQIYDQDYFLKKQLPQTISSSKNSEIFFDGKKLGILVEELLVEINNLTAKPKNFKHFKVLKHVDFNHVLKTGLIILKFKDYPFVLKLFIENGKSISKLESKSFDQRGIFTMGGCLRHFAGFSRIKNLEKIKNKLDNSHWKNKVTLPRKWFWLPKNPDFLNIEIHNLLEQTQTVTMPAIYAIICDEILLDKKRPTDEECLNLTTFLEYYIDPHTVNFLLEKNTKNIAIIDTEHFPTMTGKFERIESCGNYFNWYWNLTKHYLKIRMFSFKDERLIRQRNTNTYYSL